MTCRDRTLLLGLAALTTALAALTLAGVHQDVLLAAPALVLALLLLAGRYVGEEGLADSPRRMTQAATSGAAVRPQVLLRRCTAHRGSCLAAAA